MGVIPSKKGYLLQLPSMKPAMCTQNKKEISFNGNLNLLHSSQIVKQKSTNSVSRITAIISTGNFSAVEPCEQHSAGGMLPIMWLHAK